jgi:hypothetical protein
VHCADRLPQKLPQYHEISKHSDETVIGVVTLKDGGHRVIFLGGGGGRSSQKICLQIYL